MFGMYVSPTVRCADGSKVSDECAAEALCAAVDDGSCAVFAVHEARRNTAISKKIGVLVKKFLDWDLIFNILVLKNFTFRLGVSVGGMAGARG